MVLHFSIGLEHEDGLDGHEVAADDVYVHIPTDSLLTEASKGYFRKVLLERFDHVFDTALAAERRLKEVVGGE